MSKCSRTLTLRCRQVSHFPVCVILEVGAEASNLSFVMRSNAGSIKVVTPPLLEPGSRICLYFFEQLCQENYKYALIPMSMKRKFDCRITAMLDLGTGCTLCADIDDDARPPAKIRAAARFPYFGTLGRHYCATAPPPTLSRLNHLFCIPHNLKPTWRRTCLAQE